MTTEERLERIETALAATIQSQGRVYEAMTDVVQTIGKFADEPSARMTRIEENLGALIRAITAEHTNGKNKAN